MKTDAFRAYQILNRDRMLNIASLCDLISNETADRLSHYIDVKDCVSKIKVEKNGELLIFVSIKATGLITKTL